MTAYWTVRTRMGYFTTVKLPY